MASTDAVSEGDQEAVKAALGGITARVTAAVSARSAADQNAQPCDLVAVSKTKPVALLQAVYDCGQRRFGENYMQELMDKAPQLPQDIIWHFIGHLQSNKAKKLVEAVPNLAVVETVDSLKLAKKLDAGVADSGMSGRVLGIYLQVNTSGEESKSGLSWPGPAAAELATAVAAQCPHLKVAGLMTIGAPGDLTCFDRLVACRAAVAEALALKSGEELALSMGMSGDFEDAIACGATSVRVGSSIFGARAYTASKPPPPQAAEAAVSSAAPPPPPPPAPPASASSSSSSASIHDAGTPRFIYHVVERKLWEAAKGAGTSYLPPAYAQDGFIHATHDGKLLMPILNHFYRAVKDDFLCLEIDTGVLGSPVKMEPPAAVGNTPPSNEAVEGAEVGAGGDKPGGGDQEQLPPPTLLLPHIFGPIAPAACVTREVPVQRDVADGTFLGIGGL
jgi:pyridoxal phosphate enzyme (YggS family)